jgi:glycosyltransferase involved in cell wall biosynthesis
MDPIIRRQSVRPLPAVVTLNRMKIALIIPALNEEQSLPEVLALIPPGAVDEIVVVDNGSTDRTATVARRAGARVVAESRKGYGAACWAGFNATSADILVFMDADGSFLAHEIPRLTEPIRSEKANLVLGSRTLLADDAKAVPLHARFGNKVVAGVIGFACGIRITDLGPFRAVTRRTLESLQMQERTYGWPCEMIVKASRLGYRIREVPVSYRPRTGGESKVSGTLLGSIKAAFAICRVTARWAFRSPSQNRSTTNSGLHGGV